MLMVLQELLGYFLIGIIAVPIMAILFLPFYFMLRKRVPLARLIAGFLLVVCVLVILTPTVFVSLISNLKSSNGIIATERYMELIPLHTFFDSWKMARDKVITQLIANVLMLAPLGFIVPVVFEKARKMWKTTALAAAFSLMIEFTQYYIGRDADIDDLLMNTLGGVIGFAVFYVFSMLFGNKPFWKKLNGTAV